MDQCVEQDPQGPAVHLRALVRPAVHNLWGGVQRAATECLQVLVPMVQVGQPEICYLWETR